MAKLKTLACIGLNGFDRARLRLLLAEACKRLPMQWKLGQPEQADLLVLAERSAEAEAAGLRARGRGVRCVRMGFPDDADEAFLPAGFDIDDLVRILSGPEFVSSDFESVRRDKPEFYESKPTPHSNPQDIDDGDIPGIDDLERVLRRDSKQYHLETIVPYKLEQGTSIETVDRTRGSSRAEVRESERNPYVQVERKQVGTDLRNADIARRGTSPGSTQARPLQEFLDSSVLMAPCKVVLDEADPLILDPKNQVYLISGGLDAAEPYAATKLREIDFRHLTTRELERWRESCQARPYRQLRWLAVLRTGDGWLPRHLDPGGSYRLRRMLDLSAHFDPQIRIGQALQTWRRLHEVAAEASVDMQEVFNTVAAFDAIDWLEWQPRERFR